ncbi:hypothetical protein Pmani_039033 [Petrolisthes manimaculis]|uniref:Uncharacterized protein n=1 Tax=Petrolisthes manimaculis TaxID=1843537 RepID=A0AAE1NFS4_9EUCA|nr:hypothetical protein Pmani_039033 [Petrolisthes manimaculis]
MGPGSEEKRGWGLAGKRHGWGEEGEEGGRKVDGRKEGETRRDEVRLEKSKEERGRCSDKDLVMRRREQKRGKEAKRGRGN